MVINYLSFYLSGNMITQQNCHSERRESISFEHLLSEPTSFLLKKLPIAWLRFHYIWWIFSSVAAFIILSLIFESLITVVCLGEEELSGPLNFRYLDVPSRFPKFSVLFFPYGTPMQNCGEDYVPNEKNKTTGEEKGLNIREISSLPNKEFKIMVIKTQWMKSLSTSSKR